MDTNTLKQKGAPLGKAILQRTSERTPECSSCALSTQLLEDGCLATTCVCWQFADHIHNSSMFIYLSTHLFPYLECTPICSSLFRLIHLLIFEYSFIASFLPISWDAVSYSLGAPNFPIHGFSFYFPTVCALGYFQCSKTGCIVISLMLQVCWVLSSKEQARTQLEKL